MGKYRSKTGCRTCRERRVKCDEQRPVCGQCGKKSRPCRWAEAGSVHIKQYQPNNEGSSATGSADVDHSDGDNDDDDDDDIDMDLGDQRVEEGAASSPQLRRNSRAVGNLAETEAGGAGDEPPTLLSHRPSTSSVPSSYTTSASPGSTTTGGSNIAERTLGSGVGDALVSHSVSHYAPLSLPSAGPPIDLKRHEAILVHHYAEHLGRWLDCTDSTGQFTLLIPTLVKRCGILLHAVKAFAAKHYKDVPTAEAAYGHCLGLLIERLKSEHAVHDDALLCSIVILRFVEQLDVSLTGADGQQHLSGVSAIIRASQGPLIDPSAPTLRQACFWVYVRQCLYTASITQQPPNIDPNLKLSPPAISFGTDHPMLALQRETAWANTMTWLCACVAHFCFDGTAGSASPGFEPAMRQQRWHELWNAVQRWTKERPPSFDPIWSGSAGETSVFPEIWFTADWHATAFGYYHFSCILLLMYRPAPRFAARNIGSRLSEGDQQILDHARAMCGACTCAPGIVANHMTLCHSVFIWGPFVSNQKERDALLTLLVELEEKHSWPTTWITKQLKDQWDMPA